MFSNDLKSTTRFLHPETSDKLDFGKPAGLICCESLLILHQVSVTSSQTGRDEDDKENLIVYLFFVIVLIVLHLLLIVVLDVGG